MSALSVTVNSTTIAPTVFGNLRAVFGTYHFSTSYAAGGDTITAAAFGLDQLLYLDIGNAIIPGSPATALVVAANAGLTAVQAFNYSTGTTVALAEQTTGDIHTAAGTFVAFGV